MLQIFMDMVPTGYWLNFRVKFVKKRLGARRELLSN